MTEYTTKPAQYRLPAWAHEFIAREAAATGATKTDVVVDALSAYRTRRSEERMMEGYSAMAEENLADVRLWAGALADGMEPEEW